MTANINVTKTKHFELDYSPDSYFTPTMDRHSPTPQIYANICCKAYVRWIYYAKWKQPMYNGHLARDHQRTLPLAIIIISIETLDIDVESESHSSKKLKLRM